jgi:hypothetical protein
MESVMKSALMRVLSDNQNRQLQARSLNGMANDAIFPVLDRDECVALCLRAFNGARGPADLTPAMLEAVRLAPLDATKVAEIQEKFGDPKLFILGREVQTYSYDGGETYRGTLRIDESTDLSAMPDDATLLPNGKRVELSIIINYTRLAEGSDVSRLKAEARIKFIAACMATFSTSYRSSGLVRIPDLVANPHAELPPVCEHEVCKCPVSGEPVYTYGALKLAQLSRWQTRMSGGSRPGPTLAVEWFVSRRQAEESLQKVERAVAEYREGQSKKLGYREQAEELFGKLAILLDDLPDCPTQPTLKPGLRDYIAQFGQLNFNRAAQVLKWIREAEELAERGTRALFADTAALTAIAERLFDRLAATPEGELQDQALERISAFSDKINAGKLSVAEGEPLLEAARAAVEDAAEGNVRSG